MHIGIKKLHEDAVIPEYQTEGSAGFDIAALEETRCLPQRVTLIRTGLAFAIPDGYHLDIRPRSGQSIRTPCYLANSPGTIDSDYRGEVKILYYNPGISTRVIEKGERIAQGVLMPNIQAVFMEGDLDETDRGAGGFGHTGTTSPKAHRDAQNGPYQEEE